MSKKAFDDEPRRGPIEATSYTGGRSAHGVSSPSGGPADPKLSVRNARRAPQVFPDLRVKPNVTGTYVERHGRARLFVNHVGGHIEALLTLVSRNIRFHEMSRGKFPSLADDIRLPTQWGYAGMLEGTRKALAYRFNGDHTAGGEYVLSVPDWLGPKVPHDVRAGVGGGPVLSHLGILQAHEDSISVEFQPWFKDRWHWSAAEHFAKAFLESSKQLLFERWDETPVLLERYVARATVSFSARTLFWFGASPKQFGRLEDFANAVFRHVVTVNPKTYERSSTGENYDIFDLMKQARTLSGPTVASQRAEIVNRASDIIKKILDEALLTTTLSDGGLTQSETYLLREPILSRLNAWTLPKDGKWPKQSVASMLQSTIDGASSLLVRAPEITDFLGIRGRGYRQHIYELDGEGYTLTDLATEDLEGQFKKIRELAKKLGSQAQKAIDKAIEKAEKAGDLLSKGQRGWKTYRRVAKFLPYAYSLGFVHIKYVGSNEGSGGPQEDPWEAYYGFFMGGLDFARSLGNAKAKIKLEGTARQWGAEAMRPKDLEGLVQFLQGSAMLAKEAELGPSVVPDSVGGTVAALSFMGDLQADAGRQAVLSFVLDAKAKVKKGGKGGAGGNLKGLWGYVWSLHDTEPDDITIVSRKDEDESSEFSVYWENHLGPMAVFFPINGAHFEVPTDDEREFMEKEQLLSPRQALDAFAAAELPMMVNPLSVFKLEGFADAPDGKDANFD